MACQAFAELSNIAFSVASRTVRLVGGADRGLPYGWSWPRNFDSERRLDDRIRSRVKAEWGVRELAEKAGVTANTVTRIENGADAKQSTIDALQRALEAAGIEFTNGDQPGVRLTRAAAARPAEPGRAQSRRMAAKVVRRKTAKANERKR
jgi:transcriptional regulator with XRE-family HTH domain